MVICGDKMELYKNKDLDHGLCMNRLKTYLKYGWVFLVLFLSLSALQVTYVYFNLWQYEKIKFSSEKAQLNLIISNANSVSSALYDVVVNKPDVIHIFKEASSPDLKVKNRAREQLYALLKDDYQLFIRQGIQQLHFHLPNNESFLRFHKPSKFGDDLTNVRASVKYVNREKKFTYGFEEGRIFNGYRFVYPLFAPNKTYLGSVEISLSLLAFKERYETHQNHIDFLMKKEVVENKVFKDQQNNYQRSSLSDNFYIQNTLAAFNQSDPYDHAVHQRKIYKLLADDSEFIKQLETLDQVLAIKWIDFRPYSVKFMPLLNDFNHQVVGYTVLFSKSDYFDIYWLFHLTVSIGILMLSLMFTFALFLNQRMMVARNKSAQLTEFNHKIKRANDLLDSIINGTTDKIFYKDHDLNYLGCNEAFFRTLQITKKELIGKSDFDLFDKKFAQAFREDDLKVLASGKMSSVYEWAVFPDGSKGYFYTQKIPFIYDGNDKPGILGIARDITELYQVQEQLKVLSYTDELTQLSNRKVYNEKVDELLASVKRYKTPFCLIMLDIDDFKHINDSLGHAVGDKALISIGRALEANTRENDIVCRIGGEEFVVILPSTELKAAIYVAEKLRQSVETLRIDSVAKVTISAGVTEALPTDNSTTLLKRVDDLLYKAKQAGKNCVLDALNWTQ